VSKLTAELQLCYGQIEEYKKREQERSKSYQEFCMRVKEEVNQLQEAITTQILKTLLSRTTETGNVSSVIQRTLNKKVVVIESIIDALLQFSIPLSHRFLMDVAEKGPASVYSYSLPTFTDFTQEDYSKVTEKVMMDCNSIMETESVRKFMKTASQNIRKKINKILDCKDGVKNQIAVLNKYLVERLLPQVSDHTAVNFVRWINMVQS